MLAHSFSSLARIRHASSKAGVSEVLKNSQHLRVKVSEVLAFNDDDFPHTKDSREYPKRVKSGPKPYPKSTPNPGTKPHPRSYPKDGPKPYARPSAKPDLAPKSFHKKARDNARIMYNEDTKRVYDPRRELNPRHPSRPPVPPIDYMTSVNNAVHTGEEELRQVHKPHGDSIPKLAHKLDRVLFSPGVHFLQDPRTRVFNFSPYLKSIVSHEDFDFEKVQHFVSASKDTTLLNEAKKQNKKFYSSTSSMTSTLHQFYLFLNNYSPRAESKYRFNFPDFSKTARELPSAVFVEPKGVNEANGETIYSVTSDKSADVEILLSAMGHCLEALLTTEEEAFKEFLIKRGDTKESAGEAKVSAETAQNDPSPDNVYNYSAYGDFLMRSQLDCYDARLPGNGTFDLKTRAAASIRYDKSTQASDSNYQIWKLQGNIESFQREYEDLIRTGGLLKYGFQARIGQMDGIFVAYHNINSFFGFQYFPLSEIDKVFYSNRYLSEKIETYSSAEEVEQNDNIATFVAESQFKASLKMWQDIMATVEKDFKGTKYEGSPFRLMMNRVTKPKRREPHSYDKAVPVHSPRESVMAVYAVPMSREQTDHIQSMSSKYQTSFREEISDDERLANLEKIQQELDDYNEKIVRESALFSYQINASLYVNDKYVAGKENHPYPKSTQDKIEWRYIIQRMCKQVDANDPMPAVRESSNLSLEYYLKATQMCTNMLTKAYKEWPQSDKPTLTDTLRKYSEVGKMRADKWKELENPPKVY